MYEAALRRLAVDPRRAVAIEDSSNGLRSAASAGMGVVAVPNPAFPPSEETLALAGAVVRSLDGLTTVLVTHAADQSST